jgi:hypothetical protein
MLRQPPTELAPYFVPWGLFRVYSGQNKLGRPHLNLHIGGTACFGFFFLLFARSHLHSRSWSWSGAAVQLQIPPRSAEVPTAQPPAADPGVVADREVAADRGAAVDREVVAHLWTAAVRDMDTTTKMER